MTGNAYVAGSGVVKISSDGAITTIVGGLGPNSPLSPSGLLAMDAAGNLYVMGSGERILKISPCGNITTVAGDGSYGFAGDGGPAISAEFGSVGGLAVDTAGNIYVSDNYYTADASDPDNDATLVESRVRMVSPNGTIHTIAGSGPGYSGDGGPAINAQLMAPGALGTDAAGNLYIADGSRVRKISTDGTIITIAGNFKQRLLGRRRARNQRARCSDLHPAWRWIATVISILPTAHTSGRFLPRGRFSTVAGEDNPPVGVALGDGGPAYTALLSVPTGVAVDSAGVAYIADTFGDRVRKVTSDGIIRTVAGTGIVGGIAGDGLLASQVDVNWPSGLTIDPSGNLYIADAGSGRIRKISPDGVISTVAGSIQAIVPGFSGDGGPATAALLWWPKDIALDTAGNLYIADTGNNRIRMVTPAGIIATIAGIGASGYPGTYIGDGGPATQAGLFFPSGVATDSAGNVYIGDTNNYRVRKISPDGIITTLAGNGIQGSSGDGGPAVQAQLYNPAGLKLDKFGNLYIADGPSVRMISPAGIITTVAGTGVAGFSGDGGPATSAQLSGAWGLAFDRTGALYVADSAGNSIRVLRPAGQ